MYDLYSWKTSNGRKVTIMAEELGIDYRLHKINIGADDQFTATFTAINPEPEDPCPGRLRRAGGRALHRNRVGRGADVPGREA